MIRCPECRSYSIEDTGMAYTTYPLQYKYYCNDCQKTFTVSDTYGLPSLEMSRDVTDVMAADFFESIIHFGGIPKTLNYYNHGYGFYKALNDNYYYRCAVNDKYELIHLHIEKDDIREADRLYEELADFYKRIQEKY